MPDIYQLAATFRAETLARERTASTAMVKAYAQVYQRIQAEARDVLDAIDRAVAAGDAPNGLASRSRRLEALRLQVLDALHGFARFAEQSVAEQQREAIYSAGDHSRQLILAGVGDPPPGVITAFNRLPVAATEHLVGTLQPGGPLERLLASIAPQVASGVEAALISGLALGKNPHAIAREIRAAAGQGLTRALVISRTEVMRSYRVASLASYQENSDVVTRWRWTCSRSRRTCGMCLGMDGREFDLDIVMGTHPCCRCVMIPVTKTWAEMGYDVPEPDVRPHLTGEQWFAAQDAETQAAILGPGKLALYTQGKLSLRDLVEYRLDPQWGPTRSEKPLKDL